MHFCVICSNMYYMSIENETQKLIYYCKKCGHIDNSIIDKSLTVINVELKKSEQEFSHIINKYTKYDPSLPHANHLLCPNISCPTNVEDEKTHQKVPKEIVYIRYDNVNMKYIYLCCVCDTHWKPEVKK